MWQARKSGVGGGGGRFAATGGAGAREQLWRGSLRAGAAGGSGRGQEGDAGRGPGGGRGGHPARGARGACLVLIPNPLPHALLSALARHLELALGGILAQRLAQLTPRGCAGAEAPFESPANARSHRGARPGGRMSRLLGQRRRFNPPPSPLNPEPQILSPKP